MSLDPLLTINPGDVLQALRNHPLLQSFHLALFQEWEGGEELRRRSRCAVGGDLLCDDLCGASREGSIRTAFENRSPAVFDCPFGLIHFVLPFTTPDSSPYCLFAGGVREAGTSLQRRDVLLPLGQEKMRDVLQELERRPEVSRREVEETVARVTELLPSLLEKELPALSLERIARGIKAVTEVSRDFERAGSVADVVAQVSESLVVLFDLPRLAVILAENEGRRFVVYGGLGLPEEALGQQCERLGELLRRNPAEELQASGEELAEIFPGLPGRHALALPLRSGAAEMGVLVLLDADLHPRERLMARLLADRAAVRLSALARQDEHREEQALSRRLLSMISSLSLMENREELYRNIVEMAADLVQATSGSLMLLDPSNQCLRIESAKGMNLPLARSMVVPLGGGIAGKVARSGFPLVVNDIEKDARVAIANRPRFRTKSFISIPLKPRESVIGVLNLADREDGSCFTESDINLLSAFVEHAGVVLERTGRLERASLLEELSVTDPLTGLYNRRFLEKRLEEELSRSSRHNLSFTVIFADLDHFKIYNDLCGHLAGDHALRRVAALLRASAREMDTVTRYGGEEFCILLPGTSKKESMFVAERIRRAVEKEPFPQEDRLPSKRLATSLGIASFPEDGVTASAIIHAADIALYRAKSEGRNRLVLYESSLRERSRSGAAPFAH